MNINYTSCIVVYFHTYSNLPYPVTSAATLLGTALRTGLKADYILLDSWSSNPAQYTTIHSKSINMIAMVKRMASLQKILKLSDEQLAAFTTDFEARLPKYLGNLSKKYLPHVTSWYFSSSLSPEIQCARSGVRCFQHFHICSLLP